MRETWVRPLDWEDPLEKGIRLTHSNVLAWRIPWTVYGEGWVEIYGSGNLQNEERQFTIPFSPLDDSVSLCLLKVRFLLNHKSENPDFFLLRLLFTAANCNGWLLNSRWKSSVRLWMRLSCLLAQCFVHSSDLIVDWMNPFSSPWCWELAIELSLRVGISFRAWESIHFCIMLRKKAFKFVFVYIVFLF